MFGWEFSHSDAAHGCGYEADVVRADRERPEPELLMWTDMDRLIGAGRHDRSGDRTTYRNGYRDQTHDTRVGSLQLRVADSCTRLHSWRSGLGRNRSVRP